MPPGEDYRKHILSRKRKCASSNDNPVGPRWRWLGWLRSPVKGQKVQPGFKEVFISWGVMAVAGTAAFIWAQKDLDKRRIKYIKEKKALGTSFFLKPTSDEERLIDHQSARERAVKRQVEIEDKSGK